MEVGPVTLEGRYVRLEPLSLAHQEALCAVGLDERLWRWSQAPVRTAAELQRYVETALAWQAAGTALPFAIVARAEERVVGSTRYANIEGEHRRLEIGWSWVAPAWQRTPINTEAKYLLLHHAFEMLGCIRVEFKTDSLNESSRAALLRIGAVEEGTLRNHMIVQGGRYRHSVYYSIIESEWAGVKARLEGMLGANPGRT